MKWSVKGNTASSGEMVTDLNDGWILLAAFDEFFIGQLSIFILIHISKDFIHTLK